MWRWRTSPLKDYERARGALALNRQAVKKNTSKNI